MDRRKLLWLGGLVVTAALGCNRQEVATQADPYGSAVPPPPSGSAGPTSPYGAVSRKAKPVEAAKEADGKPSSLVKIATVHAENARDEARTPEQRQHSLKLAKQNYRRAIQLDAKYVPAHTGLARTCTDAGEHEQAVHALDAGLAKLPKEAPLWHERGMAMGRLKRFDEALKNLHQAAVLDPETAQYSKSVGLMLARLGRADEALPWLRRSLSEADARYNVARLMHHIGNADEAHKQLTGALQAQPGHEASLAMLQEGKAPAVPPTGEPVRVASHVANSPPPPTLKIIVDAPAAVDRLPQRPTPAAGNGPRSRKPVTIGFEPNG